MPSPHPPATLRAAITLDGKLDDPAPQLARGAHAETLDAARCRELLATGAVDEIHLSVRPRIDGRRDAPTLTGPPTAEFFPQALALRLLRMETRPGECLLHYRVVRRRTHRARAG